MGRPSTLPQFQSDDKDFQLMQNKWGSLLNPLLSKAILNGEVVSSVELAVGNTVVNHRLGRKPQGWMITDIDAASTIYRSAAFSELTLTLNSSAAATADIYVF